LWVALPSSCVGRSELLGHLNLLARCEPRNILKASRIVEGRTRHVILGSARWERACYPLSKLMSLFELVADPATSEKAPIASLSAVLYCSPPHVSKDYRVRSEPHFRVLVPVSVLCTAVARVQACGRSETNVPCQRFDLQASGLDLVAVCVMFGTKTTYLSGKQLVFLYPSRPRGRRNTWQYVIFRLSSISSATKERMVTRRSCERLLNANLSIIYRG
jgi:hypothetical protein